MTRATNDQLPCGADFDDLVTQVADGRQTSRSPHQQQCPHCQAALAELSAVWEPVRQLEAINVRAPAELVGDVMRRVRHLAGEVWHATFSHERGVTRVASWVVGVVARSAANSVPGVRAALGRTTRGPQPGTSASDDQQRAIVTGAVGIAGRRTVIELAITTAYGASMHATAATVRRAVIAAVQRLTGVEVEAVHVTIDDVTADDERVIPEL